MEELFVKNVDQGKVIFKEGDREPVMYHIHSGKVGIYLRYGKPDEKQLAVLTAEDPNPYFGEMGLIDRTVRSATAVALEDCELGYVTSDSLHFYLEKHPDLVVKMVQRMSGRLRTLTEEYMDACHLIADQEEARRAEKKPDPKWMQKAKKYTAIFDDPPTQDELLALAVHPWNERPVETAKTPKQAQSELKAEKLDAGTIIFKQGDTEACMYDLMQGSVAIYADYGLPTQKKLTTLTAEKNRFFGEMGLVDAAPRSATAVAETDIRVLVIKEAQMETYFVNDPETLLAVMRQMSGRIRELTRDYMEAVRTIAENERCEQNGSSKPEWLTKNLKIFADIWKGMSSASGARL